MEEFRILDLLKYFFNKKLIIIFSAILAFLVGYLYVNYYQVPMYQGTTTIIIIEKNSGSNNISQGQLDVSEKLVSTYSEIIKSRRVLDQVISTLDLDISAIELSKKIKVDSISDTSILQITVEDADNNKASLIANTVASVFKNEIVSIYNIENISIIDEANIQDKPYNISPIKYYIIFTFLGIIVSCLGLFIAFYFDNTIKTKKEIEEIFGLPVLGKISHIRINNKKKNFNKIEILTKEETTIKKEKLNKEKNKLKKNNESEEKVKQNITTKGTTSKNKKDTSEETAIKKKRDNKTNLVKSNKKVKEKVKEGGKTNERSNS